MSTVSGGATIGNGKIYVAKSNQTINGRLEVSGKTYYGAWSKVKTTKKVK